MIGHCGDGLADLPLLGDLAPRHALLRCGLSFHSGVRWSIEPLGDQAAREMRIGSLPVDPQGSPLAEGKLHELCANLRFDVLLSPSGCALLELHGGAECLGAERILLLPPLSSAIRIGAGPGCELRAARVVPAATLRITAGSLELEHAGRSTGFHPFGESFDFVLESSPPPVRLSILPA